MVVTGNSGWGVAPLAPAFSATVFSGYTATVPFKVTQLFGTASFTAGTTDFRLGSSVIQAGLTSGSISTSSATLVIGPNAVSFNQSQDGQYEPQGSVRRAVTLEMSE
jgi:hypothetical protein